MGLAIGTNLICTENDHSQLTSDQGSWKSIHIDIHMAEMRHLHRALHCLKHSVLSQSPTKWNPGGLKELTQLQNYFPLSHRATCPLGESGCMLRIHCQKVKWKTSLDLCTWIPSGERSEGRDISFSEFPKAYPNRSGCKEKQWSLKEIGQKRSMTVKEKDPQESGWDKVQATQLNLNFW